MYPFDLCVCAKSERILLCLLINMWCAEQERVCVGMLYYCLVFGHIITKYFFPQVSKYNMLINWSIYCHSSVYNLRVGYISIVKGVLIDSLCMCIHGVVRLSVGVLVDPFELPAVTRGRNDT